MASHIAKPRLELTMVEPDGTIETPSMIEKALYWSTLGVIAILIFMAGMVVAGWIYS